MKEKDLINRKTYKAVKRYDRQEMERFLKDIYTQGFRDGAEAGSNADFKIKLVQVLESTKGVGEKTIKKVLNTLKKLDQGGEEA